MAADAQIPSLLPPPPPHQIRFPNEIITNILFHSSTPTFIQLTRSCKHFQTVARSSRQVLLYHLQHLPGDKTILEQNPPENEKLFLLLRQRAANHLYGINYTANLHEYLVRNAKLEPLASSISGLDADYVRMALLFKDTADIRQYTNHGSIKEKIETCLGPCATVLKLVQWARWVSVLCRVSKRKQMDPIGDEFSEPDSDSEASDVDLLEDVALKPTANSQLAKFSLLQQDAKVGSERRKSDYDFDYRIVHFDVYTIEDSQSFTVAPYLDYIPRDFAVYSTTSCAVLWDRDTPKGRPTENATVVAYSASKPQLLYPVKYEEKVVWPKTGKPEKSNHDSDDDDAPEHLPERICFFKEGRRIKLYESGSAVPYEILSSTTTQYDQYASTNVLRFDGFSFHVDTPFFGTHATYWDEMSQHSFCFITHLCLGTATVDVGDDENENEVRVLCILRSQSRQYPDSCDHRISLQKMTHVSAGNSMVVARLWGYEELQTNLTGKEIVAVSQGGTRIAIAMWNKIYVYPINPKVLCEDDVVDSSDDDIKIKKKKKKSKKPWKSVTNSYYRRRKDETLLGWRVAEIRPVVLDLNGAVAYKMNWSPAKGPITDTYVPEPVIVIKDDISLDEPIDDGETNPTGQDQSYIEGSSEITVVEPDLLIPQVSSSDVATTEVAVLQDVSEITMQEETHPGSVSAEQNLTQTSKVEKEVDTEVSTWGSEAGCDPQEIKSEALASQPALNIPEEVVTMSSLTASDEVTENAEAHSKTLTSAITPSSTDATPLTNGSSTPSISPLPALQHTPPQTIPSVTIPSLPTKPSLKRKDKGPDINDSEINVPHVIEKEKEKSAAVQMLGEMKSNSDISTPPSPTLNKTIPKPKQTVSEALSTSPVMSLVSLQQPAEAPIPPSSNTASHISKEPELNDKNEDMSVTQAPPDLQSGMETSFQVQQEDEQPLGAGEIIDTGSKIDVATEADLSKTVMGDTADQTPKKEEDVEKTFKRKKRITEDELIVLTDRGIQVWNIGARAKGKRKRSILPLEESLKGKLPNRKGKAKAVVEEHESDVD